MVVGGLKHIFEAVQSVQASHKPFLTKFSEGVSYASSIHR